MVSELSKAEMENLAEKTADIIETEGKPAKIEALSGFFSESVRSLRFILSEKENLIFALMQYAVIAVMYFVFIQVIGWIPESVWEEIGKNDNRNGGLIDLLVFLWGLLCVGVASYFIGLFTSCMSASFILRFQGRKSTVYDCLRLVLPHSWSIWIFSWIDGWWTVKRILERLPKKNDKTPLATKLRNEAIYQAWKFVSLGFLPALMYGRGVKNSLSDMLQLARKRFWPLAKLRLGYSVICWVLGIGCYVGLIFLLCSLPREVFAKYDSMYGFYFLHFPMLVALLFIMLLFRPMYIISACRIYCNFAREQDLKGELPEKMHPAISAFVVFVFLCILVAIVMLYRDELGISEILANSEYLFKIK